MANYVKSSNGLWLDTYYSEENKNTKKEEYKCTCGTHKTYGKDCPDSFHSDWCDLVKYDCFKKKKDELSWF